MSKACDMNDSKQGKWKNPITLVDGLPLVVVVLDEALQGGDEKENQEDLWDQMRHHALA